MKLRRMRNDTYNCLVEALRRFECFEVIRDKREWTVAEMVVCWTGLGRESGNGYRQAMEDGVMVRMGKPNFPHVEWWLLTEKGAAIVLQWHKDGHRCKDNNYPEPLPPQVWPATA